MNKIKDEQLNKIKEQQQALTSTLHEIGYIEATKHGLLHKLAGINEDVESFKNQLEKEYGAVNINLETGEYTEIAKEDSQPELIKVDSDE